MYKLDTSSKVVLQCLIKVLPTWYQNPQAKWDLKVICNLFFKIWSWETRCHKNRDPTINKATWLKEHVSWVCFTQYPHLGFLIRILIKRNQGPLGKQLIPELQEGRFKMNQEPLATPKSQKMLRKIKGHVKKDIKISLKRLLLAKSEIIWALRWLWTLKNFYVLKTEIHKTIPKINR